jgi:hypothetical protein
MKGLKLRLIGTTIIRNDSLITSIIFSKDRPLQLDLCLKSIKENFLDTDQIVVIEKYSDDYKDALHALKREHGDVTFYQQSKSIYADLYQWSLLSKNNYISFFTDDNIFFKKFHCSQYDEIFAEENLVCCFSLRLGLNINRRSHMGTTIIEDIPIAFQEAGSCLIVSKTDHPYGRYWSYSHSVDGHIFRKRDVQHMMAELSYLDEKFKFKQTPNEVESQMQKFWPISENFIVCAKESCVVNSPNNRVSETHNENMSGEQHEIHPKYLLELYNQGQRIHINSLDFSNINCPHTEIDLIEGIS